VRFHVALATHDRPELLARTLASLAAAARPPGFEQVIVVETGAGGEAKAVCDRFAGALPLLHHPADHAGKSRALQWALERIGSGFVLFLDDDVRVSPEILGAYAEAARAHGRGRYYGGPLAIDYALEPPDWLRRQLPRSARGWEVEGALPTRTRFLGANFGAFAEDVLAVGGFHFQLGPGALAPGTEGNPTGQERDLQDRLRAAGHTPVYVAAGRVWHWVPTERCTPEWALERASRRASSRRLRRELARPTPGARFRAAPLALWGRLARAALRAAAVSLVADAERRFLARRRVHEIRGEIRGHQLARGRHVPGA
jgi:GT2 family glycosyltransferase